MRTNVENKSRNNLLFPQCNRLPSLVSADFKMSTLIPHIQCSGILKGKFHCGLKTLQLISVCVLQNRAQSEKHAELVSLLRLPPSTLMSAGSPVTLPWTDHQSKLCGLVYAICVHREWAWIIHPAVSNLRWLCCCVCQREEFAWSLLLSEKRWGWGGQALNIERTVTGARLTNCSRTRHFTFFFPPPESQTKWFAENGEKLSVSLRLRREKSQPLLATQGGGASGRGGSSRLVKKQRTFSDMPPEKRRA